MYSDKNRLLGDRTATLKPPGGMSDEELVGAIEGRHSVRRYSDRVIAEEVRGVLDEEVRVCNEASGLAIRVVYDDPEGITAGILQYGVIRGACNYVVLAGQVGAKMDTACGYFGERIVLLAQHLGLNTCWAGLSYNKAKVRAGVERDEKVALVVALGYGLNSGRPHRSKPLEKLGRVRGDAQMPPWFKRGLEMAALAPTAMNQQQFSFELNGDKVQAHKGFGPYSAVDLGIAQYHFEVGAREGSWSWA